MLPRLDVLAWSLGVAIVVVAIAMTVRNGPGAVGYLRRFHLVLGVCALIAFVLTGQYMKYVYAHSEPLEGATHLMFRSAHIYMLYGALLNVLLGSYLRALPEQRHRRLQIIGSVAVLVVPVLILVSLVIESKNIPFHRPIAIAAIYLSLAGGVAHLLASLAGRAKDAAS